jgi:Na+/alanine symporter
MLALIPATLGGPIDLLARALVFVVFTAGALAALTGLLARPVAGARAGARAPLAQGAQVAYASFSGIVAALLAVDLGGPGALLWLVLACLAGAAIHKIEARLAGRHSAAPGTHSEPGPEDMSPGTARGSLVGQVIRVGHAVAVVLLALSAGALLLAQQTSELVGAAGPVLPWACSLGLAAATFVGVRGGEPQGRWLGPLTLVSLGLYVALALSLLSSGGALGPVLSAMFSAAFDPASATTSAWAGGLAAAAQGVLRAAASGATGGLAGPQQNQRGAWGEPLVVAAVALLTGLAAHTSQLATPTPVTDRELLPLEHHLRGGLAPSEYGQLIVLPPNSGLEEGKRYRLVLRADPRGQKYGEAFRDENVVAAPAWDFTRTVDTVILRDKHPERSKNAGFDVKIPVRRELVDTRVGPFLKLHPIDPSINFRQLMTARDLDGPFLNVADYTFEAGVARGFHLADGARTSLVAEPRPADAPKNPQLRDFVAFNYSGPFADGERPPLALTAPMGSGLEPGDVVHLRLDTPARGLDLGFVNRLGELEVPAWDFLSGSDTAVLRHNTDPALDRTITVRSRLAFGRLRFTSPELDLEPLATLFPEHSGPFLRPPSYHFTVEVHRGARLPADHAETHLALIPVHPQTAPAGNPGVLTYDPHPGEVLLTGMTGPFLDHEAAGTLVTALARRFGPLTAAVGAAALLVLALASLVRWFGVGLGSARGLFGATPEFGFGLAFLVCVALAPALGLPQLLRVVDAVAALAVLLGLARLIARLPRARQL